MIFFLILIYGVSYQKGIIALFAIILIIGQTMAYLFVNDCPYCGEHIGDKYLVYVPDCCPHCGKKLE